ncbi:MAG: cystathionine beta-lyase, partial [Alphaproteobacteria bacterium]|nr:cystathionine beta-lyase [Alphaproteobacteria bacterium]
MARKPRGDGGRKPQHGKGTQVTEAGRDPKAQMGVVNPPVYHASTVIYQTLEELERKTATPFEGVYYGRNGTPTTFALEAAVAELEGGYRSIATASGLAAIAATLMAFLDQGDHLLMVDSAYSPTRKICEIVLKGFGIETTYYDPLIGGGIKDLIRPNTKVVFTESPGSLTFEVQDVPAIAGAAHAAGAVVVLDNSWATPLFFRPFDHGVDVAIEAATKYLVGHSDVMMGVITTTVELFRRVRVMAAILGAVPGPDDCYLALRGIRTLAVRLARHQETALALARWCRERPEVARILHPAFEGCPGHEVWARDFSGASGLFSIVLDKAYPKDALARMLDHMALFKLGYSWGG